MVGREKVGRGLKGGKVVEPYLFPAESLPRLFWESTKAISSSVKSADEDGFRFFPACNDGSASSEREFKGSLLGCAVVGPDLTLIFSPYLPVPKDVGSVGAADVILLVLSEAVRTSMFSLASDDCDDDVGVITFEDTGSPAALNLVPVGEHLQNFTHRNLTQS